MSDRGEPEFVWEHARVVALRDDVYRRFVALFYSQHFFSQSLSVCVHLEPAFVPLSSCDVSYAILSECLEYGVFRWSTVC